MTIIAAVRDPDKNETWIGADTMLSYDGTKMFTADKWVVAGLWAVGIAGSYRTTALVRAHADSLFNELAGAFDFTCRVRDLLADDGYNADVEEGPKSYGQDMVLAHPGGVWSIAGAFSIVEIPDGEVWADGSGRCYGLGAAYATDGPPQQRVHMAVSAAIRYCDGCGGDISIQRLKR